MEIVVPAAGRSSRFPGMKPKYLLYYYKHMMMLRNALDPYLYTRNNITIGILKEHDDNYNAKAFIQGEIPGAKVIVLDEYTKGPADTVYQIINKAFIDKSKPLLIKDCDGFFNHDMVEGNIVYTSNISEHAVLKKLSSKSFVIANDQDTITNIIEKNVVSDTFCVGAYQFETVETFTKSFEKLSNMTNEIFVSHIIQDCLQNGETFSKKPVKNYFDVGTAEDWFEYNDRPVIFCDIDGTLVKSQNRYGKNTYEDAPEILENNVRVLLEYQKKGAQIIFTTARPNLSNIKSITENMLNTLGFRNYQLLIGLNISKRILINDFGKSNPYPSAVAINIQRDTDTLENFI